MKAMEHMYASCVEWGCHALLEEPMKKHTSMRVGGAADLYCEPADILQLQRVLARSKELELPSVVIGRGSNLLVSDEGYHGVVICLGSRFSQVSVQENGGLKALAGTPLTTLCHQAEKHSLTGLEFAFGIPASVGGAVYMNAGAYGGEMKDVLDRVWMLSQGGEVVELSPDELELGYRHSAFMENKGVIVAASFALKPGVEKAICARMEELMERRTTKQPLEYPSSGSTFKRPAGAYAAALIEQCGLKGRRVGGAMVSEKHAGFLINYDSATCSDILALIELVQEEVARRTGYNLECEVRRL